MKNLLLIDDDQQFSHFFATATKSMGMNCKVINESKNIMLFDLKPIEHIIIDLLMPEYDGLQILRFLKEKDYRGHISFTSGQDMLLLKSAQELCELHQLRFHSLLKKPFSLYGLDELFNLESFVKISDEEKPKEIINQVEFSDTELMPHLKIAIETSSLDVFFQPQIELNTNRVSGFEALARWKLNGTFIPPTRFIAIAERGGIISQLTAIIIDKSLQQFSTFVSSIKKSCLSINLSALELSQSDVPDLLKQKAAEYNIAPSSITLEITETVLLEKNTLSLEILTRLRLMGFKLSIDDFGTGYSSVNMLKNGPFTELKIDRTFISSMHNSNQTRVIVESIIDMATRLNLRIVAEGVEDNVTIDRLIRMGCTIAQGYVFAKPMAKSEILTWLNDWHKIHNISLKNDKVHFLRGLFK